MKSETLVLNGRCVCVRPKSLLLCLTLCDPMDPVRLLCPWNSPEYWSGLPFPSLGDLPNARIEPVSLRCPDWQAGSLPLAPPGSPREALSSFKHYRPGTSPGDRRWACFLLQSPPGRITVCSWHLSPGLPTVLALCPSRRFWVLP